MSAQDSLASRIRSVLAFDPSVYATVEKDPNALWQAAAIVAIAGAGRGVSPAFEAGWAPIVGHGLAGLLIWMLYVGLVWNVAHRALGYPEGFFELARALGFAAAPLLGLWLDVIPAVGSTLWLSIALHVIAFLALVVATRAALSTSLVRGLSICVVALALAVGLIFLLGLFLVGSPASRELGTGATDALAGPLLRAME